MEQENISKGIKKIDEGVVADPNNNYYHPEKNLNTGDTPSVVIIEGKVVQVRDGIVIKQGEEQKTDQEQRYENGDLGKLDLGSNVKARIVTDDDVDQNTESKEEE